MATAHQLTLPEAVIHQRNNSLGYATPDDLDLAGFGFLGDGNTQGQHPGVVAGLDAVGVEGVAQGQLPGEHPQRPLGDLQLALVAVAGGARERDKPWEANYEGGWSVNPVAGELLIEHPDADQHRLPRFVPLSWYRWSPSRSRNSRRM